MYHVLNRAVARLPLFEKDGDYEAFERVLAQGLRREGENRRCVGLLSARKS